MNPAIARWILLGCALLAFCPFVSADLFWDDVVVIRPDGPIAELGSVLRTWSGRCILFPEGIVYPFYRPLVDISFVLEYALAGTAPFLYHLTNFLLHAGNIALLTALLRRARPELSGWAILAAALPFAVHPMQAESVLWPAARPAMMALLFFQLGLWSALRIGLASPLAGAALFVGFLAALFSKEVAVCYLPCLALLVLARDRVRPPAAALISGALCAGALVIYLLAHRAATAHTASGVTKLGLLEVALGGVRGLGFYTRTALAPYPLFPTYPAEFLADPRSLYAGIGVVAGIISVLATAALRRTTPWVLTGAAVILAAGSAVLPMIGGYYSFADRYLYQSWWALAFAFAPAADWLFRRELPGRRLAQVTAALLLLTYTSMSLATSLNWTTNKGMWEYVVRVDPDNVIARSMLATDYADRDDLLAAEAHLKRIVNGPRTNDILQYREAPRRLGEVLHRREQFAEAAPMFEVAMARIPADEVLCRIYLASCAYQLKMPERARGYLENLDWSAEKNLRALTLLALLKLRHEGDPGIARAAYDRALSLGMPRSDAFERALLSPPPAQAP